MLRVSWRLSFLVFLLLEAFVWGLQDEDEVVGDPGLYSFKSRPELTPTKWNITTYHDDQLNPGYWFAAPYRTLNQKTFGKGWVGCHIYDNTGELIWSGAKLFSQGNVEDFRMSNVNGEDLLTLMDQGRGEAILLDHHYEVRDVIKIDNINTHEFHFVENGTRAFIIKNDPRDATKEMGEAIGWYGERRCHIGSDKFVELDVLDNWKNLFDWSPYSHVGLDESTVDGNPPEKRCGQGGWDYFHGNSVDKDSEGNYYYSSRHTDTIFKISKDDKEIMYRIGGRKSDFPRDNGRGETEWWFSRQHDVRVRERNDTHVIISLLDNAKGIDHFHDPSYPHSRGLLLAINEQDMTVTKLAQFDHPWAEDPEEMYSPRRGNYQILPNGNIWMGWSEMGYQSEHAPDGTILQEAKFAVRWLGTYRQYKFPWVGRPKSKPDLFVERTQPEHGGRSTVDVYVSWNGDTEVRSWDLYKTDNVTQNDEWLTSVARKGFETMLSFPSDAEMVFVKGLDKDGQVLTTSEAKSVDSATNEGTSTSSSLTSGLPSIADHPIASFSFGFVCTIIILLICWYARRRGYFRSLRVPRYQRLFQGKEGYHYRDAAEEYDEQALPLQDSRKESLDEGS